VKAGLHHQDGAAAAGAAGETEGRHPGGVGGGVVPVEGTQAGGTIVTSCLAKDAIEKPALTAALHDDDTGNIVPMWGRVNRLLGIFVAGPFAKVRERVDGRDGDGAAA
jgi:hypothetical protein